MTTVDDICTIVRLEARSSSFLIAGDITLALTSLNSTVGQGRKHRWGLFHRLAEMVYEWSGFDSEREKMVSLKAADLLIQAAVRLEIP